MELIQLIRTTESQSKGVRQFKSGMVGIAKGQIARVNVVNTASTGSQPATPTVIFGLWGNPRSELLTQSTVTLEPGASAFLDADSGATGAGEARHQVRAVVTIVDDPDSSCVVTLEVFDKDTGKTTVFLEVPDAAGCRLLKMV